MHRRDFLKITTAAGSISILGCQSISNKDASQEAINILIDPSKTKHPVPPLRGAMWMFRENGIKSPSRGFDGLPVTSSNGITPDGEGDSYGSLVHLKEENIALAAETGINTFRCGFIHSFLEDRDKPFSYFKDSFVLIEKLFDICQKYDIKCIFDLHNAIGRDYGGDPRLWQEKELQNRFIAVWEQIVKYFKDHPAIIAYEPLNEPEPRHIEDFTIRYALWNDLSKRAVDIIRRYDTEKPIIIDSIEYAHPSAFAGLEPIDDPNIWYSFHWYEPRRFHMQKRPWLKDQEVYHYPDTYNNTFWDRDTIKNRWKQPLEFSKENNVPLFVGEFGCVSNCPKMEDMVWLLDVISLMDELNIGFTYYHYMALSTNPYWNTYFDCGMFTYNLKEQKLYVFKRKVSLLSELMKLNGEVLIVEQPDDPWVTVHAIKDNNGNLQIFLSNKSRDVNKNIILTMDKINAVTEKKMGLDTEDFIPVTAPVLKPQGNLQLNLNPLSVIKLTVEL